MSPRVHLDEARTSAINTMREIVRDGIERAVIIDDLFGRVRVILWPSSTGNAEELRATIDTKLRDACAQYWTGDLWIANAATSPEDRLFYDKAWEEGFTVPSSGYALRLNDRHRSRTAWFLPVEKSRPAWPLTQGPPIIVFHSFKGGVGRTTALTAHAIAHARRGERIVVIDFDMDAPGVGTLLDVDGDGTTARWGVVDFLLEARDNLPLTDYHHTCAREAITGGGAVEVFPAGTLDNDYLTKLARIDLEVSSTLERHPLLQLLQRVRAERQPAMILIDGRAGLSPAAGLLLSGFAHLHVLFATTNRQSLLGLERVVQHLGFEQARRDLPQAECVVVQAMVPDNTEVGKVAEAAFAEQVEAIFRDCYYAMKADEEDRVWSLDDLSSSIAPHIPVPISYRGKLAFFHSINQVVDVLTADPDYVKLSERLDQRLAPARAKDS